VITTGLLDRERPYLLGVAYRLLGSAADAEDVVQEALVRASRIDDARSPRALLTTIVTRLCLDELRSARRRREAYVGPWLPSPVVTGDPGVEPGRPDQRLDAVESVSIGLLLLLEALTPHERAVLVLRDVLDLEFAEIAAAVDRSEAACRQLLHRARAHVAARRRRFPASAERRDLAARFLGALTRGDVAAMVELLAADATAVADHGGKAKAMQRPVTGADRVARLLAGLAGKGARAGVAITPAWINGNPAVLVYADGKLDGVFVLDTAVASGTPRVAGLHIVRNPDRLAELRALVTAVPEPRA
jgi:RNA polymerase sigma-70 factor, ECF subfamily